MAALPSSSALPDSCSSRHHTYSRKQKSLGLLCSNFLSLYDHDGVHSIGLDDAASRLGVERRRIYDIVNVLESVGVLSRKAKNQYSWNGFGAIPKALQDLKEEGLKENCTASDGNDYAKVSDDEDDDERFSNPTGSQNSTAAVPKSSSSSLKADNRREKSLALLTQNFVKLFICSHVNMISLDEAAKLLLGDGHNSSIMRTKVRRLYDIANVLSSMNLIEKTHTADTRKPAFRWLGVRGKVKSEHTVLPEARKRAFGTDVTNVSYKKTKAESSAYQGLNHCLNVQKLVQCENSSQEDSQNSQDQECERTSKSYQFGPFSPVTVAKVSVSDNNNVKRSHDWESLSSTFRPQYHNQALPPVYNFQLFFSTLLMFVIVKELYWSVLGDQFGIFNILKLDTN
ncbi:E2F transcription factor-like E2FE isoform X2 [Cucurbita maxima]|uniref:E2F transcription factor-like E2FE isoform X2 n=1 Tax=Cucurbita maxima TaxID=3661 RepID=A0A6J1KKU2_CUCMA|nr:E2F transcription factor-like E2FE isoform X2 [Cucurbita maxima]